MSSVIGGAMAAAGDAINGAMHIATNKKISDMEKDTVDPSKYKGGVTTNHGVKISNNDVWLAATSSESQGPALLEDEYGREKIHRFDHERIPERVIHARGAGAFGTFKLLEGIPEFTNAGVLTDTSRTTPVFVRFSTVMGSRGSADTVRDVRGFAVKLYTEEGNWDMVGNDMPIFHIQDAMKFPDLVHAAKPEPDTEIPQAQSAHNNFWDFVYLHSEATHMFMWAMSDRGIPRSFRMMQGFGVNTYTLLDANGVQTLVKFHWTPTLGVHSLMWDEALKICGQDPDFHRKDLYTAIENGAFPKWRFGIQTCSLDRQDDFDFDLLDATKIWPEEDFPIRYIGELELNRNVDEYFTQTEQVAFCTSHVPPGIGFSDDPLLQGRNFSYQDTQLSRLGMNWEQLPVNRPVCPVMNNNRDGQHQSRITKGKFNYWPNRANEIPPSKPSESYVDRAAKVVAMQARIHSKKFSEHINQAQLFYNSLSKYEKAHARDALAFELDHCLDPIVYERMCERLCDIDLDLAKAVAEKVGAPTPTKAGKPNHGKTSKGLSQADFTPEAQGLPTTIASRMVAIIIADGFNLVEYEAVKGALTAAGALPFTIGPKRQPIKPSSGGEGVKVDHHFEGNRSTMYDAIYIPGGEHVKTLRKNGRVVHWVREAFGHCKAIGATGEAVDLVKDACNVDGMAFSTSEELVDSYGVVTAAGLGKSPGSLKEALNMVKGASSFMDAFAYNISQHRNFDREFDGITEMVAF